MTFRFDIDEHLDRMVALIQQSPGYRRALFAEGDGDAGAGGSDADAGDGSDGDAGDGDGDKGTQANADGDKDGDKAADKARNNDGTFKGKDWREHLEGDERKFADRFPSPTDAVKFAYDSRKKLSAALIQPGDDASDEELADYYGKLGRPEEASGYDIAAPDDLADHLKLDDAGKDRMVQFADTMFKANAPAPVVKAALDWYWTDVLAQSEANEAALDDHNEKGDAQLKTEWGSDFDTNIELGKRAFKTMPEGLQARLNAMGFDGDPEMKRFMATLGRNLGEDGMLDGGLLDTQRDGLEAQLKELEGSPNRWDKDVDAKITALRDQLFPGTFQRHVA